MQLSWRASVGPRGALRVVRAVDLGGLACVAGRTHHISHQLAGAREPRHRLRVEVRQHDGRDLAREVGQGRRREPQLRPGAQAEQSAVQLVLADREAARRQQALLEQPLEPQLEPRHILRGRPRARRRKVIGHVC